MILIKTEVVLLGKNQGLLPVTSQSVCVIEEKRGRVIVVFATVVNGRASTSATQVYILNCFHMGHTGQVSFNLI